MNNLEEICRLLLDNADLDLEIPKAITDINLFFFTGNSRGDSVEIVFECKGVHLFKMTKDPEESESFVIKKTKVTKIEDPKHIENILSSQGWTWGQRETPQKIYHIEVQGLIEIEIICLDFNWHFEQGSL